MSSAMTTLIKRKFRDDFVPLDAFFMLISKMSVLSQPAHQVLGIFSFDSFSV